MKKLLFTLFACLSFIYSSAQDQTGLFSVAGNLNYGTEIESLGVGLRAQYGFDEHIRGVGEYKYYIDRHNMSAWEINADLHYVFGSSDELVFYPIGGLKFTRWTYDSSRGSMNSNEPKFKESYNRIGLNLGVGSQIALSEKTFIQPEIKYEFMKDFSQFVFSVGFGYQF